MTIETIIAQIFITAAVVGLYHWWFSCKRTPGPAASTTEPVNQSKPAVSKPSSPPAPVPVTPQPAITVQSIPSTVEPEIVAVIAAAIAVVIGPHRVVSVQQTAQGPEVNVWALEGRVEQFMSHRVR